jgi:hypothetical protein
VSFHFVSVHSGLTFTLGADMLDAPTRRERTSLRSDCSGQSRSRSENPERERHSPDRCSVFSITVMPRPLIFTAESRWPGRFVRSATGPGRTSTDRNVQLSANHMLYAYA